MLWSRHATPGLTSIAGSRVRQNPFSMNTILSTFVATINAGPGYVGINRGFQCALDGLPPPVAVRFDLPGRLLGCQPDLVRAERDRRLAGVQLQLVTKTRDARAESSMTDWEAIVANDGPAVWNVLWRLLANRSDVEECFQETFVAALKVSRSQTVICWPALLCTLATSRAMDQLRKRYRRGGRSDSDTRQNRTDRGLAQAVSRDAGPSEQAVSAELSERFRAALRNFPRNRPRYFTCTPFAAGAIASSASECA